VFDSVGWGEILVLIVAGLFILGPERLPSAAAWLGKSIRQVKEYASGARDQLRGELGPEFDELRKPLDELRSLRNFNPRTMVHRTLFDDEYPAKPNGFAPGPDGATNGAGPYGAAAPTAGPNLTKAGGTPQPHPAAPPVPETLARNERPPIDDDAT
jgi:sec-independent protein translocase protein TatB